MRQRITRDRPLTDEERLKYRDIRQQIAAELPDIRRRAQAAKPRVLLKHLLHTLKQERERQGLSLADVNARSGIDSSTLREIESDDDPNVSISTLLRYADAIGKTLTVQIEDCSPTPGI
jgi:ribosome-binding protein aMBF1 (putative translation factor)